MSERQIRNVGRSCQTVASFLIKTYEILEHPEFQHMISWDKDGVGFVVKDTVGFTKEILPKYFRHGNFSSFVRQLNMYDFHKVKQENDNLVFKNLLFQKGEIGQLKNIKRKASKKVFNCRRARYYPSNPQNEKYFSTLKTLKKQIQSEINQSAISIEKSLVIFRENSDSNKLKLQSIQRIESKNPLETLDSLFQLKEECHRYFHKVDEWLKDGFESQSKKDKLAVNCISQLKKNKEEDWKMSVSSINPNTQPQQNPVPKSTTSLLLSNC